MTWTWGVAGPGRIAERFASALAATGAPLRAVASRTPGRGEAFAARHDVPVVHHSYESLAADPAVEVVYVATQAPGHERDTVRFLEAGKHVLCEKPFARTAAEARRMVAAARATDRFLMEAMWSRFLPGWRAVVDQVGEGRIGEVRMVEAGLGFRFPADSRLFDPDGGGALLDLGVYPLNLAAVVLGAPVEVRASGVLAPSGVDEHVVVVQRFAGGALAVATASITEGMAGTARITGTDGAIELAAPCHCPRELTVAGPSGVHRIECGFEGDGMRFQLDEVHRCLDASRRESTVMPLDESVRIMALLDDVRTQLGPPPA